MSDDVWKRDEIASPCVKLCMIHPEAQICTGCLRNLAEITGWSRFSDDDRAAIIAALPQRRSRLQKRRGGHAARVQKSQANPNGST